MVVPRTQLLFLIALLLPLAILNAAAPSLAPVCAAAAGAALLVAFTDALVGRKRLRGLHIQLPDVIRLSKDRAGDIQLQIRNQSGIRRKLRIGLPFPPDIESHREDLPVALPESEYSRTTWSCTPHRRGSFVLDRCYYETPSPLGLWNVRGSNPSRCEIRVYPDLFQDRKQIAAVFLNRGGLGVHSQRMIGQGREFEKLREYIHGDGYDQIHWKASAKRGKPVTKEFQIERTQEVYVVIDFSRLSAKWIREESTLEHYLRAALVLGMVAQRQGDLFGLITCADKLQGFLRASNGKAHFQACREALYLLEPRIVTPDFDEVCSFIRLRLRRRALLVFLTDLSDPILAENFVRSSLLISQQHLVLVNMVKPSGVEPLFQQPNADSLNALYENLGGHILWENLRELRKILHRQGTTLHQLDDARMSAELVTQYLNVKQRQLI